MPNREPANEIEARELSLYAVNTRELYFDRVKPIIANLARKVVAETYQPALALRSWERVAAEAVKAYRAEFGPCEGGFKPATRMLAAQEIADHYAEQLDDAADDLRAEIANRREWPLSAIQEANERAGHYFFSRNTMRFFGDTMASFAVSYEGDAIYVVRLRVRRDRDGRNMGGVGDRRRFNPATGAIGLPGAADLPE